jgi:hypothetical protein
VSAGAGCTGAAGRAGADVMSERLCVCGHPQGRHLLARRDCKSCPECTRFEPAELAGLDVTALLGEVQADADREAELAARLADVERERDEARRDATSARRRVNESTEAEALALEQAARSRRERDEAVAERRAEAERLGALLEQAEHYARDLQERGIEPASERLYDTHVRYLCTVCGGRYREHHNHPCGRLVPVRVSITFIEE